MSSSEDKIAVKKTEAEEKLEIGEEISVSENKTELQSDDNSSNELIVKTDNVPDYTTQSETSAIELEVPSFPELSISTSTDWVAVLGFAITALIVLITSRQTVNHSVELISSQEKLSRDSAKENIGLARAELTAKNRQEWINTLRNDLAKFIASTNAVWDLERIKSGRAEVLAGLGNPEYAMKELFEWSISYNKAFQESEGLAAKIKLLLNPNESDSKELSKLLDESLNFVKAKKSPSEIHKQIVALSQNILKKEWERVKALN